MRNRISSLWCVGVCATLLGLAGAAGASADGPVVRDQSDVVNTTGESISDQVLADDFVLTTTTRLTGATVWLTDGVADDDGQLAGFAGVLSWAVFADAAGAPTGSPVLIGESSALVQRDTGAQVISPFDSDIVALEFELEKPLTLAAGTYWFAVHEGSWASIDDGSLLAWMGAATQVGAPLQRANDNSPEGPWSVPSVAFDNAFVLFGNAPAWNQGNFSAGGDGVEVSGQVVANDFLLDASYSFSNAEVLAVDGAQNNNGLLDNFSGALGWAVYADAAGKPATVPVASGTSTSARQGDTGKNAVNSRDIVRLRVGLGKIVTLGAGTYWFAVHEGGWLAPDDGTDILWMNSNGDGVATGGQWYDTNLGAPGAFPASAVNSSSFVLVDPPLFASGFEAGVICAWSSAVGGSCF